MLLMLLTTSNFDNIMMDVCIAINSAVMHARLKRLKRDQQTCSLLLTPMHESSAFCHLLLHGNP